MHSSHPSEAVKKALESKSIPYKTVEMLGDVPAGAYPAHWLPAAD